MRLMLVSALTIGVAVAVSGAAQQGPPQLSPETEELAKRFPYPVIRDQRDVIPPGRRPLPSPTLGDGPWFDCSNQDENPALINVLQAEQNRAPFAAYVALFVLQLHPVTDAGVAWGGRWIAFS